MKTITKQQITKIHVLLSQNGWKDDKAEIVSAISDGRTESTKELSVDEGKRMIEYLAEHNPKERIKSLVFSAAYQSGILYGTTAVDKKINAAKLDIFLQERGTVKKPLNSMNMAELTKTHRQLIAIANSVKKSKVNKEATKAVDNLLSELSMQTVRG